MGRNTGSIKYMVQSFRKNPVNMYIHGGAILSLFALITGLLASGSIAGAFDTLLNFYLGKLLPWPFHEFLTAKGIVDFVISHLITIAVGTLSATSKWWASMG